MKVTLLQSICLILLALGLFASCPVFSQSNEPEIDSPYFDELMETEDCDFLGEDSDPAEQKQLALARCKYVVARVLAETRKINHPTKLYDLQYFATIASTIFAHLALVIGLATSMSEFRSARRLRARKEHTEMQELSVSIEGIAVKTTLVGFLILASSLVFYFLYLKTVYPIF